MSFPIRPLSFLSNISFIQHNIKKYSEKKSNDLKMLHYDKITFFVDHKKVINFNLIPLNAIV